VRKQDIGPLMLPRSLLPHQGGKDLDDANQSSSTLQDFGETSLESIHEWESHRIRTYLLQFVGISEKSIACLLLYKLRRVDFAVDANVLRIFTRLGWLKPIGLLPREGLPSREKNSRYREYKKQASTATVAPIYQIVSSQPPYPVVRSYMPGGVPHCTLSLGESFTDGRSRSCELGSPCGMHYS